MPTRIVMTEGKRVEYPNGMARIFRRGETYFIDDADAAPLIEEEVAYDEANPPACEYCGEEFTGENAYPELRAHVEDEHQAELVEDLTVDELETRLAVTPINKDDIDGSGEDGRVIKEDMIRVLKEYYEAQE